MITRIKSERIILGDRIVSGYVYFGNEKIIAVGDEELPFDMGLDVGKSYVSPGFIDIHTHGGGGFNFVRSLDDVVNGCNFHLSHGTTSICPTISAAPMPVMEKAVEYIDLAKRDKRCMSNILGAHMEGPYLSAEQCGGQCPDHITPPVAEDYRSLIERHPGAVARWTYAPENDRGGEFCRYVTERGIVASAGHTNAVGDDMTVAVKNGCRLVTHLYSCTSTITRDHGFRRLGVIESAYLDDNMYVEIIADGKHLPSELIKLILKIKGVERVALITDSLPPAGTDVKRGRSMVGTEFIIEDGVCKLLDRSAFAGSIATTDRLIRVMIGEVGVSLTDAVKMLTEIPARIMQQNKGVLAPGYDADIIVFDGDINMRDVFVMGRKVKI
ncbi:MAG: amidohydrolase family protein [Clostridia bacterium]|nr:amidohydrolase family protein [Clostridia bacterium]